MLEPIGVTAVLTPALCRDRSAECRRLAAAAQNRGVQDILLDMARTWTRLAVEAEQWVQENSPKRRLAKKDLASPTVISPNLPRSLSSRRESRGS